jgi:phosphoserine aminotransferase
VSSFGLIYGGAQKNIGPAGLGFVIVNRELLGSAQKTVPSPMNYLILEESSSMYNTPPTFSWYVAGKVFKWLKGRGGLKAIGQINEKKAKKLYDFIDRSDLYSNKIEKSSRSIMNIPFLLEKEELNNKFLTDSSTHGLLALKGHRSVGGMRASIYNAMPEEGVEALIEFMKLFERENL